MKKNKFKIIQKIKPKYKIVKNTIVVVLGNKQKCILDKDDFWIIELFGSFQKTKDHVTCERTIQTEFSKVTERIYIHRLVMCGRKGKKSRFQVDHINRNTLDNRKNNLRWATGSQNSANCIKKTKSKTGYRGVTFSNKTNLKKRFLASCRGKNLGRYETAEEAAIIYNKEAKIQYGQFAILNEINRGEDVSDRGKS